MRSGDHWKTIGALLRPEASLYLGLGVLVAAGSAVPLIGPLIVARSIDAAIEGTEASVIVRYGLFYLLLSLAGQLLSVVVAWAATTAAWRAANILRLRLARHVLFLDHEFHRTNSPGELVQRVDGDVTLVSDLLARVVPTTGGAMLSVIGIVVLSTLTNLWLGAAMFVIAVSGTLLLVGQRNTAVESSVDTSSATATMFGNIEETLTASTDLRALGAGHFVMKRFVRDAGNVLRHSQGREWGFATAFARVSVVLIGGICLSLVGGAWLVNRGTITTGMAFLTFQYLMLIQRPIHDTIDQLPIVQKASGSAQRVADLFSESPIIAYGTGRGGEGSDVVFDGVSFDYGEEPILHSIDAVFPAGTSTGIVGRTGSGKTTITRMLLRLVDPVVGEISLGGVPISEMSEVDLRRRVAIVPQEVRLLSGTVRNNVALFDSSVPDSEVVEALAAVGLDRLISAGIHEKLGSDGLGLSEGESQLLALARVWLRQPDVVVLDEATARVDPVTEAKLQEAVNRLLAGRTSLIVAHRLSTLRHVDRILVLDEGRVVEHGDRSTLSADPDSRYRALLDASVGGIAP